MANRPWESSPTSTICTSEVITLFFGTTWPRYFQVIGLPSISGSKRGFAIPWPRPFSSMKNCSSWPSASMPSEPGCTGSWKKWALKNQSSTETSFSARR